MQDKDRQGSPTRKEPFSPTISHPSTMHGGQTSRQQKAMNQDIGIVRNVGIGTSHHTSEGGDQYMEETGSESMQSVRSQVKVVIQAARREANQIYVEETRKYRTPRGERNEMRDRTRTLMLSA